MNSEQDKFLASPDRLMLQDLEARSADPDSVTKGSDFGSYARANRGAGLADSGIEHHNLTAPMTRVRIYRSAIKQQKIDSIADLGCGLGFTSAALAEVFSTSNVTGFDVSKDACEFASRKWPTLSFRSEAITSNTSLPMKYDLILAQEFYPFTRTSDSNIHVQFAQTLASSLTEKGVALITLTEGSPESILSNFNSTKATLGDQGFTLRKFSLPFDRVFAILPFFFLAQVASKILSFILRKPRFLAIEVTRTK